MSSDQETLILKASGGDPVAVEKLLTENLPRLQAYIRLKAGDLIKARESCSDLVQSVCREVLEDLPSFEYRGEGPFRYWLLQRAHHKIVDRARYHKAGNRSPDREVKGMTQNDSQESEPLCANYLTPSREAMGREELQRVEAAFQQLPKDYKEAVFLHRVVGLRHEEIAKELGRSEGAVRNLLYRGLARLALLMKSEEDS